MFDWRLISEPLRRRQSVSCGTYRTQYSCCRMADSALLCRSVDHLFTWCLSIVCFSLILRHWRALLLKIIHKPVIKEACLWEKNIPDILHVAIRSTIAEKRPLSSSLPFPKLSLILASEIDHFDRKFDVVVRVCHRDGRCCRGSRPFIVTETVYSGYTRLTVHALRRKCRKPTKWNFRAGFQQSSRPVTLSVVFRFIHWGSQSQ